MASRSKRLQPIRQHTDALARDAAAELAHAQRELTRQRDSLTQLITYRDEYGRVLATVIGLIGDIQAAEEAVQEAFAVALERWPQEKDIRNPRAWLVSAARR